MFSSIPLKYKTNKNKLKLNVFVRDYSTGSCTLYDSKYLTILFKSCVCLYNNE